MSSFQSKDDNCTENTKKIGCQKCVWKCVSAFVHNENF